MSASGPITTSSPYFVLCKDKLEHNLFLLQNSQWVKFDKRPGQIYLKPGQDLEYKNFIFALKEIVYGYFQDDKLKSSLRESRMPNHVEIYPEFESILRQGIQQALEAEARWIESSSKKLGFPRK